MFEVVSQVTNWGRPSPTLKDKGQGPKAGSSLVWLHTDRGCE